MRKEEILKEYELFLKDTGYKRSKFAFNKFKKDFLTWYVEMFGINDERTKNIIDELNSL